MAAGRIAPASTARWAANLFLTPPRPPRAARNGARHVDAKEVVAPLKVLSVPWAGHRLATHLWGPEKGGRPVIYLVHGWGGQARQLRAFVDPLVLAGFRVVGFDAPAHGASTGRRASIPDFARSLAAVSTFVGRELGLAERPYAVVAHSLGAAAAALAAEEGLRPERGIFLGAPARPTLFFQRFGQLLGLSSDLQDAARREIEERFGVAWEGLDTVRLARGLEGPLLVVHDRDDVEVPFRDGAAIAEAAPHGRLVETNGLGHRRVLKDPAVVSLCVRFLTDGGATFVPNLPTERSFS